MLWDTIQYCSILSNTTQHNPILCNEGIQYLTIPFNATWNYSISLNIVQYCAIPCATLLHALRYSSILRTQYSILRIQYYSTLLKTTQYYSILLKTTHCCATLLSTIQPHSHYSALRNAIQYWAILLNTMRYYSIRFNTMHCSILWSIARYY